MRRHTLLPARALVAGGASLAVLLASAGGASAVSAEPVAPPSSTTLVAGSDAAAVSAAEASVDAARAGVPVEVTAERAEDETVWANPSGSFTRELSSIPVRVEQDGEWVPVDYDLRREGTEVVPIAGDTDVSFSGGGDGLVSIADGGGRLSLDWPGTLPTPTLDGPTATYADVLPGVDVLMTAGPGGYTQVLRVNTAQAAANPALDQLRLAADVSEGSAVEEVAGGGFTVQNSSGDVALTSPAPTMWDSSGSGFNAAGEAAGDGDQIETMDLSANESRVVVTPDQGMLDDPDTVFPVFIDPQVSGARNEWTMVQKEYPATEFYKWDNNDGYGEGVGYQNASGVSTKRLIWEFGLGSVPNTASILDATFRVDETHSWSCTKAAVNLDRVGRIGSGTNWNNQPAQVNSGNLATSNVQVRLNNSTGGDCKKDITTIAFSTDALAGAVRNSLDENAIALRLSATESSTVGWKRFQNDATLSITYNRPPNEPTAIGLTDVQSGRGCGDWVPSRTSLPTFTGKIADPDGDKLDGRFTVDRYSGSAWDKLDDIWTLGLPSGATFERPMPAALAKNAAGTAWVDGHYRFRLTGRDTHDVLGDVSAACDFFLDSVDPVVHVGATVDDHVNPARTPDEEEWLTRGQTLTFRFDPAGSLGYDGKVDVDYYKITSDIAALNGQVVDPATLGAVGTLSVETADTQGEHWVSAIAYDRAGRVSAADLRLFRVIGAIETGRYPFEQNADRTAAPIGTGPVLTLSPGATYSVQHAGEPDNGVDPETYLTLDGADGQAAAAGSAVDTTRAFSVSAWVRAAGPVTSRQVIVSQHNASGQSFSLALEPGCGSACAVFEVHNASSGTCCRVVSVAAVQPGRWYVVAGSFDDLSLTRRIRVWVGDGTTPDPVMAGASVAATFAPAASTAVTVGAEVLGGAARSRWRGDVEDLRFYSDEVSRDDVQLHLESDDPNEL